LDKARKQSRFPQAVVTDGVGNGFKSATSQRRPFSTALSERAGADCGGKAFRTTSSRLFKTSGSSPEARKIYLWLSVGRWRGGLMIELHLCGSDPQLSARLRLKPLRYFSQNIAPLGKSPLMIYVRGADTWKIRMAYANF
jgi:hypothetical protein